MVERFSAFEIEFIIEALENGCALKMGTSAGDTLWLVPRGHACKAPHLTLDELVSVTAESSLEVLWALAKAKGAFSEKPEPPKQQRKPKLWN